MGDTTIILVFNVPVHVEVDKARRAVVSVKIDDERAVGPAQAIGGALDSDAALRCAAIAEDLAWPMWELGL